MMLKAKTLIIHVRSKNVFNIVLTYFRLKKTLEIFWRAEFVILHFKMPPMFDSIDFLFAEIVLKWPKQIH